MNVLEAWWQFVGYKYPTAQEYLADRIRQESSSLIGDIIFNETPDFAGAIIKNYGLEPFKKYMRAHR